MIEKLNNIFSVQYIPTAARNSLKYKELSLVLLIQFVLIVPIPNASRSVYHRYTDIVWLVLILGIAVPLASSSTYTRILLPQNVNESVNVVNMLSSSSSSSLALVYRTILQGVLL